MDQNTNKNAENVDFGKLAKVAWKRKKVVGGIIAGCTAVAIALSFVLPKQYESTTLVQTRKAGFAGASDMASALGGLGGLGGGGSQTYNYMSLMKSRTVLEPIIDSMDWEDEKKKPLPKDFAKKYLTIENEKQTNLITVTAKGKTPEEAQMISQAVVDNFLELQTDKNQQTQSLLVQFLDERIETAKEEATEARTKFAEYQREHGIYSPDEQAKVAVKKMNAFDDAIANMQTQTASNEAKLATTKAQLAEMKQSSIDFNINDNETVQGLRNQIVQKEVELVGLNERYTENHPAVIRAKKELAQLQNSLVGEVNAVTESNVTSLNPAQAKLVTDAAQSEAAIAVAKASEVEIKKQRDEKQAELNDFPSEVLEYTELQMEAELKAKVYENLVKQMEQSRIDKAKESMDIQVIDEANLPDEDRPVWPKKKLVAAIGFVLGCMIAFVYSFVHYKREA